MSDTPTIAPALTPAEFRGEVRDDPPILGDISYYDDPRDLAKIIALANHRLPDTDPRKITRAGVKVMREAIESWEREQMDAADSMDTSPAASPIYRAEYALLHGLADALESYLPPEGT